jgi:hypothetical protein
MCLGSGGCICSLDSTGYVTESIFVGCQSMYGAALAMVNSPLRISFSTFAYNYAIHAGKKGHCAVSHSSDALIMTHHSLK